VQFAFHTVKCFASVFGSVALVREHRFTIITNRCCQTSHPRLLTVTASLCVVQVVVSTQTSSEISQRAVQSYATNTSFSNNVVSYRTTDLTVAQVQFNNFKVVGAEQVPHMCSTFEVAVCTTYVCTEAVIRSTYRDRAVVVCQTSCDPVRSIAFFEVVTKTVFRCCFGVFT